jgi:hypothetical protein
VLVAFSGCAHGGGTQASGKKSERSGERTPLAPPAADSVTVGLWRFDENGGTHAADSGPFRLDGIAGVDTRTDFGRFRHARQFALSLDSFVLVPASPVLGSPGEITVEAWINPTAFATYEDMPIAARWTPRADEHSWLFAIEGRRLAPPTVDRPSPGYHDELVRLGGSLGALMFAFQPAEAGASRAFFSSRPIELNKWTHVAATFDGQVVRFFIDGLLDSQYATSGTIRGSEAPLVVGNFLDPRWLTDFGGELRAVQAPDTNPYYAFQGFIDELRISNRARSSFPNAAAR